MLKKNVDDQFKRMYEVGFSHFLDHMLMQNMWNMVDMAFSRNVFIYYERYYVENHGQSLEVTMTMNKEFKKHILVLQHFMEGRNKEIENKN